MGVTYTRGRDLVRRRARVAPLAVGEQILLLTSCVILLAMALAYMGRLRAEAWTAAGAAAPVNLNAIESAEALEPALANVFPYPTDRRFAARAVTAALRPADGAPLRVPNVGGLARMQVPVETIDAEPALVTFRERLDALRRSAAQAGRDAPRTMPLVTTADLAALKPAVSVRTRGEFRSAVLWCGLALVLSFHLVSQLWRRR